MQPSVESDEDSDGPMAVDQSGARAKFDVEQRVVVFDVETQSHKLGTVKQVRYDDKEDKWLYRVGNMGPFHNKWFDEADVESHTPETEAKVKEDKKTATKRRKEAAKTTANQSKAARLSSLDTESALLREFASHHLLQFAASHRRARNAAPLAVAHGRPSPVDAA